MKYYTIAYPFGIARSTVSEIVHDTMDAIVRNLKGQYIKFIIGEALQDVIIGFWPSHSIALPSSPTQLLPPPGQCAVKLSASFKLSMDTFVSPMVDEVKGCFITPGANHCSRQPSSQCDSIYTTQLNRVKLN